MIRMHNHLVHKRTLTHLGKLAKWLRCVVSIYLYGTFDCMFLSCRVCILEWIYTLQLSKCPGTSCSKQAQYLKIKWLQRDSNLQFFQHWNEPTTLKPIPDFCGSYLRSEATCSDCHKSSYLIILRVENSIISTDSHCCIIGKM